MGNCCVSGSSSSMVWAGDDWGSMGRNGPGPDNDEKEGLLSGGGAVAGAELRIKVSKKQLAELLRRVDEGSRNKAAERVLERLIERSARVEVRRRSWRPELSTIPELS